MSPPGEILPGGIACLWLAAVSKLTCFANVYSVGWGKGLISSAEIYAKQFRLNKIPINS